jgi:hypothetical protein
MRVRGLAAAAIALGLATWLATGGRPAPAPRPGPPDATAALGDGSPEALLATPLPGLRFALPLGGPASLRLALRTGPGGELGLPVEIVLVALLGMPGEWPLGAPPREPRGPGALEPALGRGAAQVPEPSALAQILLGAGGLAATRAFGRRPAGRGPVRLAP